MHNITENFADQYTENLRRNDRMAERITQIQKRNAGEQKW